MKKLIAFLLVIMLLSLSACKSENAGDHNELLEKPHDPNTYVYEYMKSEEANGDCDEERYVYDEAGNLLSKEIKKHYLEVREKEEYEYDKSNRLVHKKSYDDNILTDENTYEYNDRGDVILNTAISYKLRTGEYECIRYFRFEYEYNADGYITKLTQYNEAKDTESYVEKIINDIEYSSDNRPVSVTQQIIHCDEYLKKRPKLEKVSKTTVYLDKDMREVKTVVFNTDGSSRILKDYEIAKNGDLIINFYDDGGKLEQTEITKFYPNGLVKSNNRYDAAHKLMAERTFKYNKYGDTTEEYTNYLYAKESQLYRYDDYGNTVYSSRTDKYSDIPIERTYENTLDEFGNIQTSVITSTNGLRYTNTYSGWKSFVYTANEKESPANHNSDSIIDGLVATYIL